MREWYESRMALAIDQGFLNLAHCIASTPENDLAMIITTDPLLEQRIRDILCLDADEDLIEACKSICEGYFSAESI